MSNIDKIMGLTDVPAAEKLLSAFLTPREDSKRGKAAYQKRLSLALARLPDTEEGRRAAMISAGLKVQKQSKSPKTHFARVEEAIASVKEQTANAMGLNFKDRLTITKKIVDITSKEDSDKFDPSVALKGADIIHKVFGDYAATKTENANVNININPTTLALIDDYSNDY